MVQTCPHCGCSEIDEDTARGDATCMGCGTVLEESIVVAENQFQERSGGTGHTLVGQFVSAERSQTHTLYGVPGIASQESREVTFQKGKKLIEEVASQLRINQHCIDTAFNFFKMCVSRNFTRGRLRSHVVAACMYMTCRLENTAHLLLDFSDVTQANVYDLGRTLSFLSRSLRINLPSTDPCLYIMRFACMMELGDKQKEVVSLATRLVQRMKRDWMSTGRRPTGLCGAALLIASRSLNFNRTISDVVKVVQISESVVRKRLDEFSQTPSGALTIDEFANIDLEHCEDPPAYRESRKKAREAAIAHEQKLLDDMEEQLEPMEHEVEKAIEKKNREKFKHTPYGKMVAGSSGLEDIPEVSRAVEHVVRNQVLDSVFEAVDMPPTVNDSYRHQQYAPSLQSLGICNTDGKLIGNRGETLALPPMDHPDGKLDLTGIDDDEIDSYIMTNREAEVKGRFFEKVNGEFLKEQEKKRRERLEQEEKDKDNPKKRRSVKKPRAGGGPMANTAAEAMEKIIHEKRLSNKVNYDILKEIEDLPSTISQKMNGHGHAVASTSANTSLKRTIPLTKTTLSDLGTTSSSSGAWREYAQTFASPQQLSKSSSIIGYSDNGLSQEGLSPRERCLQRKNAKIASPDRMRELNSIVKAELVNASQCVMNTYDNSVKEEKAAILTRNRFSRSRPNFGRARPGPFIPMTPEPAISEDNLKESPQSQRRSQSSHDEKKSLIKGLETNHRSDEEPGTSNAVADSAQDANADASKESFSERPKPLTRGRRFAPKPLIQAKRKVEAVVKSNAEQSSKENGDDRTEENGDDSIAISEQPSACKVNVPKRPTDSPTAENSPSLKRARGKVNIPAALLRRSSRK